MSGAVTEEGQAASFWRPGIAIPFVLTAVIWGSTWLVIKDQLAPAPAAWSVAWRFVLASAAMFAFAAWSARRKGESLWLGWRDQGLAVFIGLLQFSLNYNLIYVAEEYVTSGIVAVIFTLLLVPNALLARLLFGQPISGSFLAGSAIAIAGVAMLLLHEAQLADLEGAELKGMVWYGIGLCFLALIIVSISNVLQSGGRAKELPLMTLTAWAMGWGMLANLAIAFVWEGIPELPQSPRYWAGLAYLALAGTVLTFPLYFKLLREMGAGRAAYNGVLIPIVAMALSTMFEGYSWSGLAIGGSVLGLAGMIVALKGRQKR